MIPNNKYSLVLSSFLIFILAIFSGCEKMEETPAATDQPSITSQMPADTLKPNPESMDTMKSWQFGSDTLASQQEELTTSGMQDFEERQAEIQTRLDSLIKLLNAKEQALLKREDSLNAKEQRLINLEEKLNETENVITWHRIISWIILVIGIIAIVAGIAIGKSNKDKENQSKQPKPSDSSSKPQPESAKKESSQAKPKSKTQTRRKPKK